MNKEKKQQVKQILSILALSILTGALLASYMIYHYGVSGSYIAGNTILAPSVIESLNAQSTHSKRREGSRLTFNSIEFSYFDKLTGQQRHTTVKSEEYNKFYQEVASERSLTGNLDQISQDFDHLPVAALTIIMQDDLVAAQATTFQIIEFVESGYFRVQLREAGTGEHWAYFYRPSIYQDIMHLFTHSLV